MSVFVSRFLLARRKEGGCQGVPEEVCLTVGQGASNVGVADAPRGTDSTTSKWNSMNSAVHFRSYTGSSQNRRGDRVHPKGTTSTRHCRMSTSPGYRFWSGRGSSTRGRSRYGTSYSQVGVGVGSTSVLKVEKTVVRQPFVGDTVPFRSRDPYVLDDGRTHGRSVSRWDLYTTVSSRPDTPTLRPLGDSLLTPAQLWFP